MIRIHNGHFQFGGIDLYYTHDGIVGLASPHGRCRLLNGVAGLGINHFPVVDPETFREALRRTIRHMGNLMIEMADTDDAHTVQ